ncbi:centrosomal protein of 97 kDa [Trichomycterus rosablanca]|uniref:centrosomal protein of 97 kDa n=1 Tax=Trichomycterus rosablanca TaxID=2290929 RepID=UPI002F35B807
MAEMERRDGCGPVTQMANYEGPGVVDLSNQGLHKMEVNFSCPPDTQTLVLDQNHIIKLEHLERNSGLQQLSVACNRLVRMMGVSKLTQLRVLNLPNNSIGYIEGLKDLVHLEWLNLAGNNIKVIEQLNSCMALQHLDLSDNNISHTGDLSKLHALKTLLLHGNMITSLRTVPAHFPPQLTVLSLAENEIRDVNEVSYLAPLHNLEQLSIMSNPCVTAAPSLPGCDYRPYVVSWCLSLKVLDGYVVSQKEGLKAEWLYSQGKSRTYRPGQHLQLVQYLASTCPLTFSSSLQSAEDTKLERILRKQRQHQRQLLQESHCNSPSPPRPTQLDVDNQHWTDAVKTEATTSKSSTVISQPDGPKPIVQVNTWTANPPSVILPSIQPSHCDEDSLILEDMQTDEEKLNGSLLSSESAFLPVNSVVRSPSPVDSEESELYEPDSLAPPNPDRTQPSTTETETSFDGQVTENHAQTDASEVCTERPKVAERSPAEAAVKIQAWWRGHWTRRRHPEAREVRNEIRLRRLQDHIVYLTAELQRVRKQQEEEKLQRMVQEEAVKFLWKQIQSMLEVQCSLQEQLTRVSTSQSHAVGPVPACSKDKGPPMQSEVSIPESGFHSPGGQQGALEDSMGSVATAGSPKTVRTPQATLSPERGADGSSQDCSLLEQYLSSVQRQEQEEEEEEEGEEGCISVLSSPHRPERGASPDVEMNRQGRTLLNAEM